MYENMVSLKVKPLFTGSSELHEINSSWDLIILSKNPPDPGKKMISGDFTMIHQGY